VVTVLLGVIDDPAELELKPIDRGAELLGIDLAVVQVLNLIKSQPAKCHDESVQMFALFVKH
jgi:hypothetical protein